MELSGKITQQEIQQMFGPTMPIEAAIILQNATSPDDAREQLRRLTPSAEPEVDEATRVWREIFARGYSAVGFNMSAANVRGGKHDVDPKFAEAAISHLREVLAAKDAERDEYKIAVEEAHKHWHATNIEWNEEIRLREAAESELASKDAEIARLRGLRYGDLEADAKDFRAESELVALRAENERLKATLNTLGTRWALRKAAERNTAEPPGHTDLIISPESIDAFLEANPPTDTTPGTNAGAVEVTQVDREATAKVLGYQCWADATDYRLTGEQDRQVEKFVNAFARHRTEAEARGRREALEKLGDLTDERWAGTREGAALRGLLIELKRLMTEGK